MQVKIVITLDVYLFLRQLIKSPSIVLTVFLKKTKELHKNRFLHFESKAEILRELKTRQFKKLVYDFHSKS